MGDRVVPRAEDGLAPGRGLSVRAWGAAGAPPLVYWPGLTIAASFHLDPYAPHLAELGYRVLAVDPPGWRSPPLPRAEYRPTALTGRLLDAIEEPRFAFVGWSWGATIGVHLGALAPERLTALALLDAGYTDFQDDPAFAVRAYDELVEEYGGYAFESWDEALGHASVREAFREEDGRIRPAVAPEAAAGALVGVVEEPPSEALAALATAPFPVLLVAASATAERVGPVPLERFRERVPAARVITVESPHDVLAHATDETLAALAELLASAAAASRRSPA